MAVIPGEDAFSQGWVTPTDKGLVQPASIDVRLDRFFMIPSMEAYQIDRFIDPSSGGLPMQALSVAPDGFHVIESGDFVLASTYEEVRIPRDVSATFEGKSSLGRIGLGVHVTAGFIDPGFMGQITIELSNVSPRPIMLWAGMKIGQIVFSTMTRPVDKTYGQMNNSYQGQRGPTPYRVSKDFRKGLPREDYS